MPDLDPDAPLVQAARGGCVKARDQLIRRYFPIVWSWVRPRLSSADANDVTQLILIAMCNSIRHWQARASWRSYVYRIAQRHLQTALMRQRVFTPLPEDDEEVSPAVVPNYDSRLELARVLLAISALPPTQRIALTRAGAGDSTDELADVLDCNPNTARSRLSRARSALRDYLAS